MKSDQHSLVDAMEAKQLLLSLLSQPSRALDTLHLRPLLVDSDLLLMISKLLLSSMRPLQAVELQERDSGNQLSQQITLLLEREHKPLDISQSMMVFPLEVVRTVLNYSRAFIKLSIKIIF